MRRFLWEHGEEVAYSVTFALCLIGFLWGMHACVPKTDGARGTQADTRPRGPTVIIER